MAPEMSYLCISTSTEEGEEEEDKKVTLFAQCNEAAQQRGLRANEWLSAALSSVGGKGGGKAGMAQGSAVVVDAAGTARISAAAERFHQGVRI